MLNAILLVLILATIVLTVATFVVVRSGNREDVARKRLAMRLKISVVVAGVLTIALAIADAIQLNMS